ncbi:MAG TPA: cytochrome c oxidase subunit II [Terriglobales bacterium]|jgi:cytochrome c oxidase subunit 2|nr:cytochrome c oxidase subunit II [Terriglobales bacterium]
MNVEFYEKIWMWAATGLLALFLGTIVIGAASSAVHPPGKLETVDPTKLLEHPEFSQPGVKERADGSVVVVVLAETYAFTPDPIEVPANRPVTFRLTSSDVMHGFQVVGTNANAMAIPGYVTEFTISFKPGEYTIGCNEYCGVMHHNMVGKLIAKEAK